MLFLFGDYLSTSDLFGYKKSLNNNVYIDLEIDY